MGGELLAELGGRAFDEGLRVKQMADALIELAEGEGDGGGGRRVVADGAEEGGSEGQGAEVDPFGGGDLGFGDIPEHAQAKGIHPPLVQRVQLGEGIGIAVFGALDSLGFAGDWRVPLE